MLHNKPASGAERVRYFRIRKKALKAIKNLTTLAKELPEDQLKQVFNKETLTPFFRAVFNLDVKAKDHKEYITKKESKELKEKRYRLLKLSVEAIQTIGDYKFARAVVPEPVAPYLSMSFPPIENIRALCYMSLQEE